MVFNVQRAQDLSNVTSYRQWVLFGYLVCPDELLRVTSIDIALVSPGLEIISVYGQNKNRTSRSEVLINY